MSSDERAIVAELFEVIEALPVRNTPSIRRVRRAFSRRLNNQRREFILKVAKEILATRKHRWVAYELVHAHKDSFRGLGESEIEKLGQGIDSWWTVDSFARTLAGPAWRDGRVSEDLIKSWANSKDRWWRRAALVSTVALNVRSEGGRGDVPRTLEICILLADDDDDMVAKALSWALRELVVHDREAVWAFLSQYKDVLAARVRREVTNKLETGLKNPRKADRPTGG